MLPAPPSTFSSRPSRARPRAKRFLHKALGRQNHPVPRVINTDKHAAYPPATVQLKADGVLEENCTHRPVPYLNNVLEQDHRAIKRRINASQHFRSFWGAWRTIAGYEAIHDSQRPGKCDGHRVRFVAPLYCWYVCNRSLVHTLIAPSCLRFQSCNTALYPI
jgi:transposase-like protein